MTIDDHQFKKNIPLRTWSHMCFVIDDKKISFYFNGKISENHVSSKSHKLEDEILAIVGTKNLLLQIISGRLADSFIYGRILSQTEIMGLATLTSRNIHGRYDVGDSNSYSHYQYWLSTFSACDFQNPKLSREVPFFLKRSCNEAKRVCKRFGGVLPSKKYLTTTKDVFVEKDQLSTIWASDTEKLNDTCQLVTMNAAENTTWDRAEIISKSSTMFESTFMCVIPRNVVYRFRQSNDVIHEYYYSQSSSGLAFSWVSSSAYKVLSYNLLTHQIEVKPNGRVLIYDVKLGEFRAPSYYETTIEESTSIMGRHLWKEDVVSTKKFENEEFNYAVFSQCADDEFTCNNGFCVNLNSICDFKYDCEDWSDEESCPFVTKPSGHYDKSLSPAIINDGKQTPLALSLSLDRIVGVMMADSMIELSLTIALRWADKRLVFRNLMPIGQRSTVNSTLAQRHFWNPRIYLPDAAGEDREAFFLDLNFGSFHAIASKKGIPGVVGGYERK